MDYWAVTAGCFALCSVAISLYEIIRHLRNFTKPYLQRYIIRILLMVPIYSLNAWIAMVLPATGLYLDSMREVYESFVIYSFMKYLLNFLKYDTNLQQYISHKPGPGHIFPLCFLARCVGGKQFLIRCKHGILQYVVVRPTTTLLAFTSQLLGLYGEGNYNPLSGYVYPVLLLLNNASQITAMYCLVIFYTGYQHELRPMRPLAKFFSIKLVVFFSFFQSVVISGLLEIEPVEEMLRQLFPELPGKVALGRKLQEFLICFDMLLAAFGHLFAFSHKPFEEPEYSRSSRLYGSSSNNDDDDDDADDDNEPGEPGEQEGEQEGRNSRRRQGSRRRQLADSDEEAADDGRTCCAAFCSILDFSEDKSDISEHISEIFRKLRQTFTLGPSLPVVLSSHVEAERRRSSDSWRGGRPAESAVIAIVTPPAPSPEPNRDSRQSSGLGSTLAGDDSLEGAGQSINSTVKNYQSIV